jgi:hypothetical protein
MKNKFEKILKLKGVKKGFFLFLLMFISKIINPKNIQCREVKTKPRNGYSIV